LHAWSPEWWWLAYLALGLVVGFFAGMLGIGGGVIIVPLLVFLFAAQHFQPERVLHLALGTSLASIVFTNLSSVRAHHLRGGVRWDIVRAATPAIIAGTLVGTAFADRMSSRYLAIIFTVFVFFSSLQMWVDSKPVATRTLPGRFGLSTAGFAVGALCSLVGVGGGILVIPLMTICNVPMINAIGTSAAIGLPISIGGALGYIITGLGQTGLPPLSLGYVYIPALVALVAASFVTVPLGAHVAHRTRVIVLRRIFAVVLFMLATRMLLSLV
jgi:uncharacterized membrane protein YfcA